MHIKSLILESIDNMTYDMKLSILAQSCGAIMNGNFAPEFQEGVFSASFISKDASEHFVEVCFDTDYIDDDIDEYVKYIDKDGDETDVSNFRSTKVFMVFCYLREDLVDYGSYYVDDDGNEVENFSESLEAIDEVRRKIKVNAKGVKRIKMQCQKGFKWNSTDRVCQKITGSELSTKRKAIRQAIRTKKSMGASLRIRTKRKTAKAKRFRKSMGLR